MCRRPSRKTYKWSKVLEAVGVISAHADGRLVAQDEGDFNDTHGTSSHQCISKDGMDHGADHQSLRMSRHGVSSHHDHNSRNHVALGAAVAGLAEPHAQKTSTPPDYTHSSVLQVVVHPGATPAVLGEGVDTAPGGNDRGVKELLATASATEPVLSNQQQNCQQDTVGDESTAHDEMRRALPEVITLTESERRDSTKQNLHPADDGHRLSENAVSQNKDPSDACLAGLLEVELQVETQGDLDDQEQHEPVGKGVVGIWAELAAFVGVTEEVGDNSDARSEDLNRDVPARANDLSRILLVGFISSSDHGMTYSKHHTQREHNPKGKSHQQNMNP